MMRSEFLDVTRIIKDKSILRLFDAVHDYGGALRFVGGAVRDAIAGLEGFEIDLATDLTPDELVEACNDKGIKTISLGLKFAKTGVVMGDHIFEVSSLHKRLTDDIKFADFSYTDDWNADASNRDLTINAVYADENGNVFDYYNGIEDLEKGIVRFIGKSSDKVIEQPIRILRFFRFYSIFSKTEPDLKSLKACVENRELLKTVAIEQIRDEFFKILTTKNAGLVLEMMRENDILSFMLPQNFNAKALSNLDFVVQSSSEMPDVVRRLFVLFEPDQALSESLAMRLKLTKVQKTRLINLARFSFDDSKLSDLNYIKRVIFVHGKQFVKDKILIAAALSDHVNMELDTIFQQIENFDVPTFPLNGKDLIELGMIDCSPIKEILGSLKNLWIESNFELSSDELKSKARLMIK